MSLPSTISPKRVLEVVSPRPLAQELTAAPRDRSEYERHGDVDDVVFPCGYTMDVDGDTLNIYYGAADCAIALARASVRSLLEWLDANGSCERRQRAQGL